MRSSGGVRSDLDYSAEIQFLLNYLSPIQREFVEDPWRFKVARAGRRGGKSVADAVYLILTCLREPDMPTMYVGITRDSAKKILWPVLLTFLEKLKISYTPFISELKIVFDNGSYIQLFGADASNARIRLRGQHFKLVIVDEMAFYTAADDLIQSVLLPMIADLSGTICMTSSPGEVLGGFFYECDVGDMADDWHQYRWTLHDNPHFQQPAKDPQFKNLAEEELHVVVTRGFGGDYKNPSFRREYLNELVADSRSLVYPFTSYGERADHNVRKATSNHTHPFYKGSLDDPIFAIGIDVKSGTDFGATLVAYSEYSRDVEIVEAWKDPWGEVKALGKKLEEWNSRFDPVFVVAHTGRFGKTIVGELKRRYKLPIVRSSHEDRSFHQKLFAEDLADGYIKVIDPKGLILLKEWGKIVKDKNGCEIEGQDNFVADAALHAYRKVYQVHLKTYEEPESEEDKMLEWARKQYRAEKANAEEWD